MPIPIRAGVIRDGGETTRPKCSSAEVESLSECKIERPYMNGFLLRGCFVLERL